MVISLDKLAERCRKYVKCDVARIVKSGKKMYLIIGFKRNTKQDSGTWINQDGERIDFDYLSESVIASGWNNRELFSSAREYERIRGMSMEDYLLEQIRKRN